MWNMSKNNNKGTITMPVLVPLLLILNKRHSGVFIVNFERISHLVLVFLLLTLSR